ncbi:MAG: hypothetical protein D6800_06785 [Candidatus Zixiibacteriota bacterium]|nr:MAG: hypothetical protein D6800_06785 [candidate division Zixibacteria bacterium]
MTPQERTRVRNYYKKLRMVRSQFAQLLDQLETLLVEFSANQVGPPVFSKAPDQYITDDPDAPTRMQFEAVHDAVCSYVYLAQKITLSEYRFLMGEDPMTSTRMPLTPEQIRDALNSWV